MISRKGAKKREEEEQHRLWVERHERARLQALAKLKKPVAKPEPQLPFSPRARRELPKPLGSVKPVQVLNTDDYTLEELEALQRREAQAQAEIELKKLRTAPVYNKGGAQYFTEEMAQDMANGSLRRRS